MARDVDTGAGGQVHYSCWADCGPFEVRGEDGAVVVAGELDAETRPRHTLTIMATDAGQPQLSTTSTVIVYGELHFFYINLQSFRKRCYTEISLYCIILRSITC